MELGYDTYVFLILLALIFIYFKTISISFLLSIHFLRPLFDFKPTAINMLQIIKI